MDECKCKTCRIDMYLMADSMSAKVLWCPYCGTLGTIDKTDSDPEIKYVQPEIYKEIQVKEV